MRPRTSDPVAQHCEQFRQAQRALAGMSEEQQLECCRLWLEEGLRGLAYLRGGRAAAQAANAYCQALLSTGVVR